jgi:hypothetical protein
MNTVALEPLRWSRRRWLYTIAAVFAFQAIFVFALGRRERPVPQRPPFPTLVDLVPDDLPGHHPASFSGMDDPTLLALPNLRGFSGSAWLRFAPLEYQPGEWSDAPNWLTLDDPSLGEAFSRYLAANETGPPQVADKPLPSLLRYEPIFPNDPVPARSRFRVEGPLAGRRLLAAPPLLSWEHSELLSNSVVRVTVDGAGSSFSAVLLTESGFPAADQYALGFARELRFQPLARDQGPGDNPGALTWGRLIFQWHTLPLPPANGAIAPP